MKQTTQTQASERTREQRQELFNQYRAEMDGGYGFGAPSQWGNGPRNFAAFLRRIETTAAAA